MRRKIGAVRPSRGERDGRPQGGMEGAGRGGAGRTLTMNDASSYVREVKDSFSDQPEKYKMFLKIMKDFKTRRTNRARVVARARELFKGHDGLVNGFNVFLPEECQITALYEAPAEDQPVTSEEAVRLIDKIKERFRNEERVSDEFFHILYLYRLGKDARAVYHEVARLFADHPDLFQGFERFMPYSSIEEEKDEEEEDEEEFSTLTPVPSYRQMTGVSILKPRIKIDKDCAALDHNEDMTKRMHKDDRNATGSDMSC